MRDITKVATRDKLAPRREPYWLKLDRGAYLGYRKLTSSSVGNWIARHRDADSGKTTMRALGEFGDRPATDRYGLAKSAAEGWLKLRGLGGATDIRTLGDACRAYVEHVRAMKGETTARDIEARFGRWVHPDRALGSCELARLSRYRLETWRKALASTPAKGGRAGVRAASSVNRDCTALRAALNYAHRLGAVASDAAWLDALRPTRHADGRRTGYLDRAQRRALIDAAPADLAQYLEGLCLLPLRPGALAALAAGNFERRTGVLTIGDDKAGAERRIRLPAQTAALLSELARDKLPGAPLFARADGSAWDRFAWRDGIRKMVSAAGLPIATSAYTLRHSTITDLVTGGLDLMTVAQISGTSVQMIERHYAHLQSERAAAALATLEL